MVIYCLLAILLLELLIAYVVFGKNILTPPFVLCGVFVVATINLVGNIEFWSVSLHWNTVAVICGGILVFELVSLAIHVLCKAVRANNGSEMIKNAEQSGLLVLQIKKWKMTAFLLFNLLTLLLVLNGIISIARAHGGSGAISTLITVYRLLSQGRSTSEDISFSFLVNQMYALCKAGGYIWIYILINNYLAEGRIHKMALANLVIALAAYLISGGRAGAMFVLISGLPMYYFLQCRKLGKMQKLGGKFIFRILLLLLLVMISYRWVGNTLLGRGIQSTWSEHISINLSAPILNLDIYLQETWSEPSVWGYNTFGYLIKALGRNLGVTEWMFNVYNPFRYVNGRPLGNVGTTFYAFVHDFSYAGVAPLMAAMAVVMQSLYEKCCAAVHRKETIQYTLIVYSYLWVLIGFLFFSNKFYENVVTITFVKTLLFWWAISFILFKLRINIRLGTRIN